MADELNDNVLRLYRGIGFKASIDEGQLDTIRQGLYAYLKLS